MTLIQCPECGKRVSSYAESCPECGYPIIKQVHKDVETQLENSTAVPLNSITANDSRQDNEQVFIEPDFEHGNSTIPNNEEEQKHAKKRKLWIIPVLLICLLLTGVFIYSMMLQNAEQKKAEARQLYQQKEYRELSWLVNDIPEFLYDDEWELLKYAGNIGFGYSTYTTSLYSDKAEAALRGLMSSVWSASQNNDHVLTDGMLYVQEVIVQDYYTILEDYFGLTKQQIEEAINIGNKATGETRGNAIDEYVATLVNSTQDKTDPKPVNDAFAEYISTNNVTLDNYDVQYNMANNLDQEFTLIGYAELDDYYNYGFDDDIEPSYYCLKVTPVDGNYSNIWYIYCHRSSLQELFDKVQSVGEKYVKMICYIPKGRFEQGQNNMAMLRFVVY